MRRLVRGVLPLGIGVVCDSFAGSGSTLAAAEAVGYESVGVERDRRYFEMAKEALPRLAAMKVEPAVAIKSGRGTPSSLSGV
jgi:site-specific DNA-methyltransferase (adenine-specific)